MEKGSGLPEGKNGSLRSETTFSSILTPNHPTNCPLLDSQLSGGCSSTDPTRSVTPCPKDPKSHPIPKAALGHHREPQARDMGHSPL